MNIIELSHVIFPLVQIDFGVYFLERLNWNMGMMSLTFVVLGAFFMVMSRDLDDRTGGKLASYIVGFGVASLIFGGWPLLFMICWSIGLLCYEGAKSIAW